MKLSFVLLCVSIFISSSAKLWTVDNSAFSKADTTSIQAAINIAAAGDSIVIMPSLLSYGSSTLSKKLFIYSASHQPQMRNLDMVVKVDNITISSSASGTKIIGVVFSNALFINASSCTIQNCEIKGGVIINSSNNQLIGNIISSFYFATKSFVSLGGTAVNNQIIHNYFSLRTGVGTYNNTYSFIKDGDTSTLIRNNVMVEVVDGGGSIANGGLVFFNQSKCKIHNNILWSNVPNRTDFDTLHAGCTFARNITYSANSSVDTLVGVNFNDTMPQFLGGYNDTLLPFYRTTNTLQLSSSSVGKNAGTDGTDVGLFGNNYLFRMQGGNIFISEQKEVTIRNSALKQGENLKFKLVITPSK